MAPFSDILVFSQIMSSGSGALSTEIFSPLILKLLKGMQGVHKHCKIFWKIFGLYWKNYFDYCRENTITAIEAVFYKSGSFFGLNY